MAKKKSSKILGVLGIFFKSINSYFLYLDQCIKYLAFPIFGQLISLVLILTIAYYFNNNAEYIRNISPLLENDKNLYIVFCVILLPLFLIFVKAVYDYILAFCALNILFFTVSGKKKVKDIDFNANKKVIERKLPTYIILMMLITILVVVPPFILLAPIIWIFICLAFQVFTFEDEKNPVKPILRSIELVKGNVIPTTILIILVSILTYWFLPELFIWAFGKISVTQFIASRIEIFSFMLPLVDINDWLSVIPIVNLSVDPMNIGKFGAEMVISLLVVALTLPYRCCCFTELYRLYDYERIKEFSKETDEIITRATESKRKN